MELWTADRLQTLVTERLRGLKFISVSNREPYIHVREQDAIKCITPASGLTTAIDPILRASRGTWVAHGSGSADREVVDRHGRVAVPPGAPSYLLRRVWLPKAVEDGYYYGLANEGLWPLCHVVFERPQFRSSDWAHYRKANEMFADAVLEEAAGEPAFVFIQDYHLGLLPRILKSRNPKLVVAQFWHIPWPNRETFRAFPWKDELLDGMLGNDLLGFHLRYHCSNFLDTIDRNLEAMVNVEHASVLRRDHLTRVRAFPISIDFEAHTRKATASDVPTRIAKWIQQLGQQPELLGIGIDRADYTKGIPERFEALDLLFQRRPEYLGRFTFVQVAVPTRTRISAYSEMDKSISHAADSLNRKWSTATWQPVKLIREHISQEHLIALHLMADLCVVSSLHDGMNLVAKEFVASRLDGDGVLILSAFTGAARELEGALIVNPFSLEEVASAISTALEMPAPERNRRMNKMRGIVSTNNIYRWAAKIVQNLSTIEESADFGSPECSLEQLWPLGVS